VSQETCRQSWSHASNLGGVHRAADEPARP